MEQQDIGAVIYWWNPLLNEKDYEEFDSLELAMIELETYKQEYPRNTYYVASVVLVHEATEQWQHPLQYKVFLKGASAGAPPQADK